MKQKSFETFHSDFQMWITTGKNTFRLIKLINFNILISENENCLKMWSYRTGHTFLRDRPTRRPSVQRRKRGLVGTRSGRLHRSNKSRRRGSCPFWSRYRKDVGSWGCLLEAL